MSAFAILQRLLFPVWMLLILLNSFYGYHHPFLNWDAFPYTGLGIEAGHTEAGRPASLREAAQQDLIQAYGREAIDALNGANAYTRTVAQDDAAFESQLPFYRVKPLYISTIGVVGHALGSYARAAFLICGVCFVGVGLALWRIRPAGFSPMAWFVLLLVLLFNSGTRLHWMAWAASPDPLAIVFFLAGFYGLFCKPALYWVPVCFGLSVWARPDYMVFEAGLLALYFWHSRSLRERSVCLGTAVLLVVLYFANTLSHQSYPMVALWQQAILGPFAHTPPLQAPADFAGVYWQAVQLDLATIFTRPPVYFCFAALAYVLARGNPVHKALGVLAMGIFFFRVLLLPIYEWGVQERFFFMSYVVLLYGVAGTYAQTTPTGANEWLRQ